MWRASIMSHSKSGFTTNFSSNFSQIPLSRHRQNHRCRLFKSPKSAAKPDRVRPFEGSKKRHFHVWIIFGPAAPKPLFSWKVRFKKTPNRVRNSLATKGRLYLFSRDGVFRGGTSTTYNELITQRLLAPRISAPR